MAQITQQTDRWLVSGAMTMEQVCALLDESAALPRPDKLEIDLAAVSDVDTTAISLLFEWMRQAQAGRCQLTFANLPENLASLATLYGVLELIPHTSH
ncbi:MAG TPA: STAS domain-containing protein [Methylophilaceae bacterium]|nr:STAS domain-containing protein [Methylophilaceae bacterium]